MIVHRYSKAQQWTATAVFPHANPKKYNAYTYEGYGATPEEATINLFKQLEGAEHAYYYTYWKLERHVDYVLDTTFNHYRSNWFTEIYFMDGATWEANSLLAEGSTPTLSQCAALRELVGRGVHFDRRRQGVEADSLFAV